MHLSQRPLHRTLIKWAHLLRYGPGRAHFQDAWPGLLIDYPKNDQRQVTYKGRFVFNLLPVETLEQHAAPRVYIIGSAPSIRTQDLGRLPPHSAIAINGGAFSIPTLTEPLAFAAEDERFIWTHFRALRRLIAPQTTCLLSVPAIRAICELDVDWLKHRRVILIDSLAKPYRHVRRSPTELATLPFVIHNRDGSAALSTAPTCGVIPAGSIAVTALQFALACKPHHVGLFGIDISNANEPRYYETAKNTVYSGLAKAESKLLSHFELGLALANERGITLSCHSRTSALLKAGYTYDDSFALPSE